MKSILMPVEVVQPIADQKLSASHTVRQHVLDETTNTAFRIFASSSSVTDALLKSTTDVALSNTAVKTSTASLVTTAEPSGKPHHEQPTSIEKTPIKPQTFSAPQSEWDPTR